MYFVIIRQGLPDMSGSQKLFIPKGKIGQIWEGRQNQEERDRKGARQEKNLTNGRYQRWIYIEVKQANTT